MPTSSQVQNVKLGACNVSYAGVDLGLTKGGVSVSINTQLKSISVATFGEPRVNDYIISRTGTVKVPMAETDLNKLVKAIVGATLSTAGGGLVMTIPSGVGSSLYDLAQPLILHPTALAGTDTSQDVNIALAAPTGNLTFDFQAENERIYQVEFTIYVDRSTSTLMTVGGVAASPPPPPPPPPTDGVLDYSSGTGTAFDSVLF